MKNFWPIVYFLFIASITYVNVLFGQASQVVYFLEQNKSTLYDEPQALLQAVVIANSRGVEDAFVSNSFTTLSLNSSMASATLSMYALTVFSNHTFEDYLAIYIHTLAIEDPMIKLDNQEDSHLTASIRFNQMVGLHATPKQTFVETMITLYDASQKLILLPIGELLNQYPTLSIERMTFAYDLTNGYQQEIASIEQDDLTSLTPVNLTLSEQYKDIYATSSDVSYLPNLKDDYAKTIHLLYSHIFWELVFVIPLTYLLFFHRQIKMLRKKQRLHNENQVN
jgi:hypothetical protein